MVEMMEHLDADLFNDLKAVMGDELSDLIKTFNDDSVLRIEAIRLAIESAEPDAIRRAAHDFKGSSSNMAASKLADLCRSLELMGRQGNVQGCEQYLQSIQAEYLAVKKALSCF